LGLLPQTTAGHPDELMPLTLCCETIHAIRRSTSRELARCGQPAGDLSGGVRINGPNE